MGYESLFLLVNTTGCFIQLVGECRVLVPTSLLSRSYAPNFCASAPSGVLVVYDLLEHKMGEVAKSHVGVKHFLATWPRLLMHV